jgi:predicted DNA-binding transcriptional regulator AlpA
MQIGNGPGHLRQDLALGSSGVSPDDLVSASGIAGLLKVSLMTAHRYSQRQDFPEPLGFAAGSRVWLKADVDAWGKAHLPLPPGRPPKKDR